MFTLYLAHGSVLLTLLLVALTILATYVSLRVLLDVVSSGPLVRLLKPLMHSHSQSS